MMPLSISYQKWYILSNAVMLIQQWVKKKKPQNRDKQISLEIKSTTYKLA